MQVHCAVCVLAFAFAFIISISCPYDYLRCFLFFPFADIPNSLVWSGLNPNLVIFSLVWKEEKREGEERKNPNPNPNPRSSSSIPNSYPRCSVPVPFPFLSPVYSCLSIRILFCLFRPVLLCFRLAWPLCLVCRLSVLSGITLGGVFVIVYVSFKFFILFFTPQLTM